MKRCWPCILKCSMGCMLALWCAVLALAAEPQPSAKADRHLTNRVLTLFSTDKGLPVSDGLWIAAGDTLIFMDKNRQVQAINTFRLRAINADGVESAVETVLRIEKELRFYESPWFWVALGALALLLAGLLIYVVVRVKTRNMQRRQQEYKDITDQALRTIAQTIDAKDSYTNGHSLRVAEYACEIARRLGMNAEEQEKIYYIGLLHDIGKVGIPDAILNKPAPLTEAESVIMRRHTTIGAEILKNFKALPDIGLGALCHHEYYRGHGYPSGIEGEHIPKIGRIICVADAYDAMATKRAYQPGKDRNYIISELEKNSGTQFDPEIARVMIDMLRETTPER